jgi:hypothetical protein
MVNSALEQRFRGLRMPLLDSQMGLLKKGCLTEISPYLSNTSVNRNMGRQRQVKILHQNMPVFIMFLLTFPR